MKQSSNKSLALILVAVISLIVLIVCIVMLVFRSLSSFHEAENIQKLTEDIGSSKLEYTTDESTGGTVLLSPGDSNDDNSVISKYSLLYSRNQDLVGWISIDNTKINYPVMQTLDDEEYYLHRDFNKEDADSGLPFMDTRCIVKKPSTNFLIFGHNMKNGDMFADLLKYEAKDYYENHKIIRFDTIYEEAVYEVIAVFRTRVAYKDENTFRFYNFIDADSELDFDYYIANINALRLYDTGVSAKSDDTLLTLATCEYSVDDGRFVVVARKIN